jgi:hypothetical protein
MKLIKKIEKLSRVSLTHYAKKHISKVLRKQLNSIPLFDFNVRTIKSSNDSRIVIKAAIKGRQVAVFNI